MSAFLNDTDPYCAQWLRNLVTAGHIAPGHARGPWSNVEWLTCRDGKARPTQPGIFPLAHGLPSRVGRLRAYGNAVVPQVAAAVIRAYMHTRKETTC